MKFTVGKKLFQVTASGVTEWTIIAAVEDMVVIKNGGTKQMYTFTDLNERLSRGRLNDEVWRPSLRAAKTMHKILSERDALVSASVPLAEYRVLRRGHGSE